jgi:hypothetical protein
MTARKYNDGNTSTYTVMVVMLLLILIMFCGCNIEKRIQQAKIDAVTLDHAQNPCVSDSVFTTTQGETLVLIDSVTTRITDTLTQTDTLKTTITITKQRTDTVIAVVVDKRLVNDYKDSVNRYKLINANLSGQYTQQAQTLTKAEKRATNLLIWLLALCVAIVIGIVLWIVIKIRPL